MDRLLLKGFKYRYNIVGWVILLYIATVLLLTAYTQIASSWSILAFGLFLGICGSLVSLFLLQKWEKTEQFRETKVISSVQNEQRGPEIEKENLPYNFVEMTAALSETQAKHRELVTELNKSHDQLHRLEVEKNQFQQRIDDIYHEFNSYKISNEEELQRKTVLLTEYQETINQQREVIKKKQELLAEYETKIRDLNYEVKTLVQLTDFDKENVSKVTDGFLTAENPEQYALQEEESEETEYFPMLENQVKTPEEASKQLKRCIDIAQKITGAAHFNSESSRFRDLSIDNFALDMRRLFDSLRSESVCTIVVFSQKENKMLFANNQAKSLLGWNIDKFVQNFPEIIQEGEQEWRKGLSYLTTSSESKARLLMKTKTGQNLLVHCHLGMIPRGIFRNHIIGVLYPA